ncbi:MAG TPA: ThiF family adenylyltransferase [Kiritimatiellia bacterium]|nr:ThiF family adenylyltransferase [Kiritimatiellia bacterium]HMP35028.1 ThiF family adenylyltransferase [Kiritimatiellia bacterium]
MDSLESKVTVTSSELEEDRFSRFELIGWWKQDVLSKAKVLVIGAGALGNEILKNLALLGVGHIVVIDMDNIEMSNLSRSVLFREEDIGRSKAEVAAQRVCEIYPQCRIKAITANVMYDVGLGLVGWADVVIGALDNREARLWINRSAWKMNRPWIDGAIEGINGVVRVFMPGRAPCYECTLGERDWEILAKRMSCNLLTREQMEGGKTPTTPTTSSVIAGIQVQEAIKLLHGMPCLAGKGFVFEGMNHTSYLVEYTANDDCMSHEIFEAVLEWPKKSDETTVGDLLDFARSELRAADVVLEFSRDIIWKLKCHKCGEETEVFSSAGKLRTSDGLCPKDGEMRDVITMHSYGGRGGLEQKTVASLGLPLWDVITIRSDTNVRQIIMSADMSAAQMPD